MDELACPYCGTPRSSRDEKKPGRPRQNLSAASNDLPNRFQKRILNDRFLGYIEQEYSLLVREVVAAHLTLRCLRCLVCRDAGDDGLFFEIAGVGVPFDDRRLAAAIERAMPDVALIEDTQIGAACAWPLKRSVPAPVPLDGFRFTDGEIGAFFIKRRQRRAKKGRAVDDTEHDYRVGLEESAGRPLPSTARSRHDRLSEYVFAQHADWLGMTAIQGSENSHELYLWRAGILTNSRLERIEEKERTGVQLAWLHANPVGAIHQAVPEQLRQMAIAERESKTHE